MKKVSNNQSIESNIPTILAWDIATSPYWKRIFQLFKKTFNSGTFQDWYALMVWVICFLGIIGSFVGIAVSAALFFFSYLNEDELIDTEYWWSIYICISIVSGIITFKLAPKMLWLHLTASPIASIFFSTTIHLLWEGAGVAFIGFIFACCFIIPPLVFCTALLCFIIHSIFIIIYFIATATIRRRKQPISSYIKFSNMNCGYHIVACNELIIETNILLIKFIAFIFLLACVPLDLLPSILSTLSNSIWRPIDVAVIKLITTVNLLIRLIPTNQNVQIGLIVSFTVIFIAFFRNIHRFATFTFKALFQSFILLARIFRYLTKKLAKPLLEISLVATLVVLVFYFIKWFIHQPFALYGYRFLAFLIVIAVTIIITKSFWINLISKWESLLLEFISHQVYSKNSFAPEKWLTMIRTAIPKRQYCIIKRTTPETLGLTNQEFLDLLITLVFIITNDPAKTAYLDLRRTIEADLNENTSDNNS